MRGQEKGSSGPLLASHTPIFLLFYREYPECREYPEHVKSERYTSSRPIEFRRVTRQCAIQIHVYFILCLFTFSPSIALCALRSNTFPDPGCSEAADQQFAMHIPLHSIQTTQIIAMSV